MNIYISNLSFKISDDDVKNLFSEYGEVSSAKVITDKFTGYSRGFAFVDMPDDTDSQKAIDALNNKEMDGKNISVKVAKPKEERQGSYPVRSSYKKY